MRHPNHTPPPIPHSPFAISPFAQAPTPGGHVAPGFAGEELREARSVGPSIRSEAANRTSRRPATGDFGRSLSRAPVTRADGLLRETSCYRTPESSGLVRRFGP